MNDLRLIILIIGLCIIAIIYFWETSRQRRQNRRQTVNYPHSDENNHELKITPGKHPEPDYSAVLSDLTEALNKTRQREDEDISRILKSELKTTEDHFMEENPAMGVIDDLFDTEDNKNQDESSAGEDNDVVSERIVNLYVTARQGRLFSGNEIRDAAIKTGLEFGALNIYHKFGIEDSRMDQPLFSVADMYEPGSFDPDNIGTHSTRGLTLFMCQPTPIDDELVFEFMLNTARDLADELGGEVRGPDRELLTEQQINSIHRTISGG